jgi:hypothetical protein
MTSRPADLRALAVDIRHVDTHALLGVALLVPAHRYVAVITDGSEHVEQRTLAEDAWVEIDAWAAAGDAALPKRPAPLAVSVASVMLRQTGVPVIAERFASIPLEATSPSEMASLAQRALPGFLISRRTAA